MLVTAGATGARFMKPLTDWMEEEGDAGDLTTIDWVEFDFDQTTQEDINNITDTIAQFFLKHTMSDIYAQALKRRIQLFPMNSVSDILSNEQLSAREFWSEVKHEELGIVLKYPGDFIKSSETRLKPLQRAPLIGEHNYQVYRDELGINEKELEHLIEQGVV
jgi:crotonobetainyl-CoA:carnitine CoA-transferase CaiB-like acyl-CoA transferase